MLRGFIIRYHSKRVSDKPLVCLDINNVVIIRKPKLCVCGSLMSF